MPSHCTVIFIVLCALRKLFAKCISIIVCAYFLIWAKCIHLDLVIFFYTHIFWIYAHFGFSIQHFLMWYPKMHIKIGGWWLALLSYCKKVRGSSPGRDREGGLSVWSLYVLPVSAWVLGFLPQPNDMQDRWRFNGPSPNLCVRQTCV